MEYIKAVIMTEITIKGKKVPVLRQEISSRGGGIEIDLTPLGFEGGKMTAYQNYLGGGLLGAIASDNNIKHAATPEVVDNLNAIAEELKKYFHGLTNPDDEFEGSSYEDNQKRPKSAY